MRVFGEILLATVAVTSVAAYVDDQNDAVVIEAARTRGGRQLWGMYPSMGMGMGGMMPMYPGMQVAFGMGQQQQQQRTPASTIPMGMYPAGTMPLSPLAQALCMLPTGSLGWCSRYGQPGLQKPAEQNPDGKWYPGYPGVPGGFPGGAGGLYPGGFPGAPGGGFPGAPGGGFPGAPGGGFPGAPGGGFPGAPGGGFPGAPGGGLPGSPGSGFPGAPGGGFPGGPGGPPQGGPPSDNGDGVDIIDENGGGVSRPDDLAIVTQEELGVAPVDPIPVEVDNRVCGKGKYFPIRYAANGSVAEEIERVNCYGDCSRIVNGADADQYEWPWIAALLNNGRQFCGGSLIDSKHILTAAHCVASMSRYEVANLRIRLGEYKIKQTGETEIWESKAARVVRHKEFSQNTLHKDVAIITMEDEVPTSLKHVSPVCLPTGHQQFAGRTATVIGWGSLRENGPQPDTLQEMTVKLWDNAECKKTYGNAAPGGIMDHMLCAGKQGKDSCSGDSGGPMQIGTGDYWTQIGIVSWGIGCGKSFYPGVYTRVTEVRDWIDKITKEY